ncbi:LysM peptidoglycan-binding domain-containing protein [Aurantimonas sp. VKM B-3413]|uniref:LysM peptidoglycan-binding domain-containing protein n=1 Tax=Aurantimonas sp. VKM B-3413 TaxID=2779401 RepID=UPI001E3A522E|nr:LysM peptidoglycan-binding domain-containing protein [Aurantimonas sp. VKM B-3413]MCB8838478.1 LysM peptidoglycan-binding domain-containing protein [Aurantimonas sp. VKM B-3413]
MQRRALGVVLFCLFILVAIAAGYWDMLASEKLRISKANSGGDGREVATLSTRSDDLALPADGGTSAGASRSGADRPAGVTRPQQEPSEPGQGVAEQASQPAATDGGTEASALPQAPTDQAGDVVSGDKGAAKDMSQPLPSEKGEADREPGDMAAVEAMPGSPEPARLPGEARDGVLPEGDTQPRPADAAAQEDAKAAAPQPAENAELPAARASTPEVDGKKPAAAPQEETALPLTAGQAAIGGDPASASGPKGDEPQFDLLRVEPDGSTVVAGRSAPGSRVMLRDGGRTIGSDKANRDGEFAIVLDRPLPPGEHEIRIHSADEAGNTKISREAAIVSIPLAGRADDLLAMIDSPDAPSKLVELPKAREMVSPSAAKPAGQQNGADAADADLPLTSKPSDKASAETVTSPAGNEVVMLPRTAADDAASAGVSAPEATLPRLRVEAVEIDNGRIFIAGAADSGATVRVYVDNVFLAASRADAEERFLVSADHPLVVGDHLVRADQLKPGGGVSARVEVPFFRPEGGEVAAVAPRPDPAGGASDMSAPAAPQTALGSDGTPDVKDASSADGEARSVAAAQTAGDGAAASQTSQPGEAAKPQARDGAGMDVARAGAAPQPEGTETAGTAAASAAAETPTGSATGADATAEQTNPAVEDVAVPQPNTSTTGEPSTSGETMQAVNETEAAGSPSTASGPGSSQASRAPDASSAETASRSPTADSARDGVLPDAAAGPAVAGTEPLPASPATASRPEASAAEESAADPTAGRQDGAPEPRSSFPSSGGSASMTEGQRAGADETGAPNSEAKGPSEIAAYSAGGAEAASGYPAQTSAPDASQDDDTAASGAPDTASADEDPAAAASPQQPLAQSGSDARADPSTAQPEAVASRQADANPLQAPDMAAADPPEEDLEDGVTVRRQARLATARGRVIIRKGDTLWRISRDTYGHGNRYTVIYLANGDQIRNPDLIYPGQVFRMPENQPAEQASPAAAPGPVVAD